MTARTADDKADARMEFTALKGEQGGRINWRDGQPYLTFLVYGWLLATRRPLLVPVASLVLGWSYLRNDLQISMIGRYLREHPLLNVGWESDHQADVHRMQRKAVQLGVDLVTFPGTGLGALTWYWTGPTTAPGLAASAVAALVMAGLAWQFALYSGLPWRKYLSFLTQVKTSGSLVP
jgi:hypothetical protein